MKKNQKWIWIGLAVVLVLGGLFFYFSKEENGKEIGEHGEDFEPINNYAEPGTAESVKDISPECQKKYKSWSNWMKSTKGDWYKKVKETADKSNTPIDKALERTWLWTYNQGSVEC